MKFEIPFRFILPLTICFQKCFLYYLCFYRSQRSWGKVIFSVACVKNSVHEGGVPGQVHLPWSGTPPGRYTLWAVHPRQVSPGRDTPLGRYPLVRYPPGQVPPQHSACWEIRATSGRYASYWNVILLYICDVHCF